MNKPLESKENLDLIPTSLQTHAEVVSLRTQTSASAKECGNVKLKEGNIDDAIRLYSCAIDCDPTNHLLFSNRSAAFQSKKQWREASADAQKCVQLCSTFAKGYVHLGRSQVQLKHYDEALSTVAAAVKTLDQSELANVQLQLNEITTSANSARSSGPQARSTSSSISSGARAEALKDRGNDCYKDGEYQDAIRFYSQAIAASPSSGSYYGNRAAAWVMLKEFKRAIQDCSDGIDLERALGEADKLRVRKATAMGKFSYSCIYK
jgi:tetratricopeptide (TPR) repeat protein